MPRTASETRATGATHPRAAQLARLRGIVLVNLATLTWASNMTLGRWLRDDIGPVTLAASRFLVASALLAALLRRLPREERRLRKDRWLLVGMALSGVVVFTPTLYLGLQHTTTVNATLINGTGPLITGLLAVALIGERMTRQQVGAAVLGLAGVIALISGGHLRFWRSIEGSIGDLIVLGAVALWALYSVLGRRVMHHRSALSASAFSALLGLPFLLLGAFWEISTTGFSFSLHLLLPLLYIGVAPGVIGLLSWNAGVRTLGASGAMVFYNTLPLYGALLGHLLLGEPIGWNHLFGGALIVGGGVLAAQAKTQRAQSYSDQPSQEVQPMAEITVTKSEKNDSYDFQVTVEEGSSQTRHQVTLSKAYYVRLTGGNVSPEQLVQESFHFLLEREPKESILGSFDLSAISNYFPAYEGVIKKRL